MSDKEREGVKLTWKDAGPYVHGEVVECIEEGGEDEI